MRKKKVLIILLVIVIIITVSYITFENIKKPKIKTTGYELTQNNFDITYGSEKAPLKVFMYSSYSCVFCRKFFNETFPLIKKNFIDNGKIQLIVKLVDLTNDEYVLNSLKLVVCINQYGNIEPVNKLLLNEPDVVYSDKFLQTIDDFISKDSFVAECILSGVSEEYLKNNIIEFRKIKLTGTPTFIINNRIYKGFKEYKAFAKIIKKELKSIKIL
jgi:protein-disulfide isomerase